MYRKYFIFCVVFSLWTIVQTSLHLVFVIYAYYLSFCETSPTQAPTIFLYLTYLYNKQCMVPILQESNGFSSETLEGLVLSLVKNFYSEDSAVNLDAIVTELLNKIDLFPDNAAASSRASVFLLSFIILDGVWFISAVALLMGTCCEIKQSLSLVFYGPWLMMTACISVFDAAASISFGLDVAETINFTSWLKFVGIEETSEFEHIDENNLSLFIPIGPTLALCCISCRFVIIWISNCVGFFYVIKAAVAAYREPYKNTTRNRTNIATNLSPHRNQMDLDTSAARIRNWQLFYGAIETTSTHSNASAESENDLNSNSNNKEIVNNVEIENERKSSGGDNMTTFYYAYSDVAENIGTAGGSSVCLDELRSQLPWSYFPSKEIPKRRCSSEGNVDVESKTGRNVSLRSDSSTSGTEL